MTSPLTADLSDAHLDNVQYCAPVFHDYGDVIAFSGPITTIKVIDDNAMARAAVESPGEGRVLVIDGGASMNCALLGGNLAAHAQKNGWAGVVINGCVRDRDELKVVKVGVKALNHHPKRPAQLGTGEAGVTLKFAGVTFVPGAWLYADADGIILADKKLT